jgi:hypothetical protein
MDGGNDMKAGDTAGDTMTKNILIKLIKMKGICDSSDDNNNNYICCHDCPLNRHDGVCEDKNGKLRRLMIYNMALSMYINRFGKESLMEELM